ncbi:MAG: Stp1/IreP family PP2C-type Ser/Thr phosphatase [Chloroflexi bacterium]|nr:Stp1/IreP family PP2C-type Ser/Thr phosphatase [Chloroflexota bacterium]
MRQLAIGARLDVGRVRANNEDNYCAILPPYTPLGFGGVLAVADGIGGQRAGEVASQMAVDGVAELFGPDRDLGESPEQSVGSLVQEINGRVFTAASRDVSGSGMGTTLTVAVVESNRLFIGHVGDSRAYRLRGGQLTQLTPDHSWVAEEVARGAMTPEEAANHPRRNIITRAIGAAPDVDPFTAVFDLMASDSLVLCSDGLHGLVSDDRIKAVLESKSPEEAADVLVDMANTAGGIDNIAVVVARVLSTAPSPLELWTVDDSRTAAEGKPKRSLLRSVLGAFGRK